MSGFGARPGARVLTLIITVILVVSACSGAAPRPPVSCPISRTIGGRHGSTDSSRHGCPDRCPISRTIGGRHGSTDSSRHGCPDRCR